MILKRIIINFRQKQQYLTREIVESLHTSQTSQKDPSFALRTRKEEPFHLPVKSKKQLVKESANRIRKIQTTIAKRKIQAQNFKLS